jgi:hypothetical protein
LGLADNALTPAVDAEVAEAVDAAVPQATCTTPFDVPVGI